MYVSDLLAPARGCGQDSILAAFKKRVKSAPTHIKRKAERCHGTARASLPGNHLKPHLQGPTILPYRQCLEFNDSLGAAVQCRHLPFEHQSRDAPGPLHKDEFFEPTIGGSLVSVEVVYVS